MEKVKILFVCIHNSARSQMAETFMNAIGGGYFVAESAGLEPGTLNPLIVESMKEIGFDISGNTTKGVFDCYKEGRLYNYVITVCDETSGERCPIFPGVVKRLHWSFDDPSALEGSHEDRLKKTRVIRNAIRHKVEIFMKELWAEREKERQKNK